MNEISSLNRRDQIAGYVSFCDMKTKKLAVLDSLSSISLAVLHSYNSVVWGCSLIGIMPK